MVKMSVRIIRTVNNNECVKFMAWLEALHVQAHLAKEDEK